MSQGSSYHSMEFYGADVEAGVYVASLAQSGQFGVEASLSQRGQHLKLALDLRSAESLVAHLSLMIDEARARNEDLDRLADEAGKEAAPW